jgi:hypothetical protein
VKCLQEAINNHAESMRGREFPLCFESKKQYTDWVRLEMESNTVPVRQFICRDCDPIYQRKMSLEGRCVNSNIDIRRIAK